MTKSYSMRGVMASADAAVLLARQYLTHLEPHSRIHDVQNDPRFMHRGVDLLWEPNDDKVIGIEVKGDRNARRGNYFFELISNYEKDTPGCFLYSSADILLYVFLETREVHHLPLQQTRDWFVPLAKKYELRHTQTRAGKINYTTVGAIVPIKDVVNEVSEVKRHRFDDEQKQFDEVPNRFRRKS